MALTKVPRFTRGCSSMKVKSFSCPASSMFRYTYSCWVSQSILDTSRVQSYDVRAVSRLCDIFTFHVPFLSITNILRILTAAVFEALEELASAHTMSHVIIEIGSQKKFPWTFFTRSHFEIFANSRWKLSALEGRGSWRDGIRSQCRQSP